jgi:hypothetical protein
MMMDIDRAAEAMPEERIEARGLGEDSSIGAHRLRR